MIPALLFAAATAGGVTLSTTEFLGLLAFGGFTVNRICDSADKKKKFKGSLGGFEFVMEDNVTNEREVEEFSRQVTRLERLLNEWESSSYARQRDLAEPIFDGLKRIAPPEIQAQMNRMTSMKKRIDFIDQLRR